MSVETKASKTTDLPKFKSEAEEAELWDRNPDFIADQFEKAAKEASTATPAAGTAPASAATVQSATDPLIVAARSLGISTEGKTKEQIAKEIADKSTTSPGP